MAGQSDPHLSLFSSEEVEFLAEDEMVEIVPNFNMAALEFFSGKFGPFKVPYHNEVPMWLAIALKKRWKCTILPPQWIVGTENLTEILEAERTSEEFGPLPFHYMEISKLLFDCARDDIPQIYMVKSLIEDIRDVRFHKVESGLQKIENRTLAVKLASLSAMEANIVRPFMVRSLQAFFKHDSPQMVQQPDTTANRRPQAADRGPRRELRR